MPRYEFSRDYRGSRGPKLARVINAETHEEASALFEAAWIQKLHEHRTTMEIQAMAMTPEALMVKQLTRGIQ